MIVYYFLKESDRNFIYLYIYILKIPSWIIIKVLRMPILNKIDIFINIK